MAIKILYWIAASGWIVHLVYWCIKHWQYKKRKVTADDLVFGLFSDYVLAACSMIGLCLLGVMNIYLGGGR